jgi:hypothetical protein
MRQLSVTYLPMRRLRSGLFWAAVASAIGFAIILAVVAAAVLSTGWASAAEPAADSLDTIVPRYQQAAPGWESTHGALLTRAWLAKRGLDPAAVPGSIPEVYRYEEAA